MGQINTREVCLFTGTATTNGTGPDINMIQGWQAAIVTVTTNTVSGTSPTLNVIVQNKLGQTLIGTDTSGGFLTGTAVYDDLLAFGQLTTSSSVRVLRMCTGDLQPSPNSPIVNTADYALLNGTLTAGSYRPGPIGGTWAVKFVIGGTSPSFAFSVQAQLIPFST